MDELKADLAAAPADYAALFARARVHGEMFHRATLALGGGGDRRETIERSSSVPPKTRNCRRRLTEKLYDAGRYMFLCAAGESAPNLYGIWTGTWNPYFSGDYTTDANVRCAVASGLSADLPELMQGCFNTVESWIPDMQLDAEADLWLPRRVVQHPRVNNCLFLHFGNGWPGEAVTSCGGWLAQLVLRLLRVHGRSRVPGEKDCPAVETVGLVLRGFLQGSRDEKGKFRFCPSMSPESMTGANATIDIAVAREVLANLIAASEELHADGDKIAIGRPSWRRCRLTWSTARANCRRWPILGGPTFLTTTGTT